MVNYYFLDTSAIIKRYTVEVGTVWVEALATSKDTNQIILCEISLAEIAAALAAKHRAPSGITKRELSHGLKLFLGHCSVEYKLTAVNRLIIDQAVTLAQNHRLRGCDAIQLATALATNEALIAGGLMPLTFVAADKDLLAAAQVEGLATENPNLYP